MENICFKHNLLRMAWQSNRFILYVAFILSLSLSIHFVVFLFPIEPFISNERIKIKRKIMIIVHVYEKEVILSKWQYGPYFLWHSLPWIFMKNRHLLLRLTILYCNQFWQEWIWIFQNVMYNISPFPVSHDLFAELNG